MDEHDHDDQDECIHMPGVPKAQCFICNGHIKVERAAESKKARRRATATNGARRS